MRPARPGLVTIALLAAVAPAWAGTLVTPTLPIDFTANQRAMCAVVNSGTKALNGVEVRIYRSGDTVADSVVTAINPGNTMSLLATAGEIGMTPFVRCVAEGSGIGKKTPVTLCVLPAVGGNCIGVVTAP